MQAGFSFLTRSLCPADSHLSHHILVECRDHPDHVCVSKRHHHYFVCVASNSLPCAQGGAGSIVDILWSSALTVSARAACCPLYGLRL